MRYFIAVLTIALLALHVASQYTRVIKLGETPSAADIASFRADELARHNYYRNRHVNTSSLTLSSTINDVAQAYAQQLVANNLFQHSGNPSYGQNLYKAWAYPSLSMTGYKASDKWYAEQANYNYQTGLSNNGGVIGHFTAMVWDDVRQVGFGYACGNQTKISSTGQALNGPYCVVVANYSPTPNWLGYYTQHVKPLKP